MSAATVLKDYCDEILEDQPKLDAAIKNLISIFLSNISKDEDGNQAAVDQLVFQHVMSCARLLSKEFNAALLSDVLVWCEDNPQGETSASDRMTEVAQYKAAKFMLDKVIESGQKPSKIFGKKFLLMTKCWGTLRQKMVQTEESYTKRIDPVIFKSFFGKFDESITNGIESSEDSDAALVWCVSLTEQLKRRQEKRVVKANAREAKYKETLTGIITGSNGVDGAISAECRVEEVDGDET